MWILFLNILLKINKKQENVNASKAKEYTELELINC